MTEGLWPGIELTEGQVIEIKQLAGCIATLLIGKHVLIQLAVLSYLTGALGRTMTDFEKTAVAAFCDTWLSTGAFVADEALAEERMRNG